MKDNKQQKKQSRREQKETIVLNPGRSADPPQPQGKSDGERNAKL